MDGQGACPAFFADVGLWRRIGLRRRKSIIATKRNHSLQILVTFSKNNSLAESSDGQTVLPLARNVKQET